MLFLLDGCRSTGRRMIAARSVVGARPHPASRTKRPAFRSCITSYRAFRERCGRAPTARRLIGRLARTGGQRCAAATTVPGAPSRHRREVAPSRRGRGRVRTPTGGQTRNEAIDRSACTGCGRRAGGMHAVGLGHQPRRAREPVPWQPRSAREPEPGEPGRPRVAVAVGLLGPPTHQQPKPPGHRPGGVSCSAVVTESGAFVMVSWRRSNR